ncbi:hypothetical protein T03_14924, partial [Trichinella britovi]
LSFECENVADKARAMKKGQQIRRKSSKADQTNPPVDTVHARTPPSDFLAALPQENLDKRSFLINFVYPRIYSSISGSSTYEDIILIFHKQTELIKNE